MFVAVLSVFDLIVSATKRRREKAAASLGSRVEKFNL